MADLVVEDFGRGARQRAQTVVAQHRKIVGQRHAGELHAVNNLHRREGMNVHSRHGILHGAKNVAVVELGKIARQAALYADLGGAQIPGFDSLSRHVIQTMEVSVAFPRPAAERTELASHETDVRKIDVPVHNIGDDVAREFRPEHVRCNQQAEQVVALGIRQGVRLLQG